MYKALGKRSFNPYNKLVSNSACLIYEGIKIWRLGEVTQLASDKVGTQTPHSSETRMAFVTSSLRCLLRLFQWLLLGTLCYSLPISNHHLYSKARLIFLKLAFTDGTAFSKAQLFILPFESVHHLVQPCLACLPRLVLAVLWVFFCLTNFPCWSAFLLPFLLLKTPLVLVLLCPQH